MLQLILHLSSIRSLKCPKKQLCVKTCAENYWCFAQVIKKCRDRAGPQRCHRAWCCVLNSCSTHGTWSLALFLWAPTGVLFLLASAVAEYSLHRLHHSCHNSLLKHINTIRKKTNPQTSWSQLLAVTTVSFPSCLARTSGKKKSKCKCQWNLTRHT